jgi:steroid 5-alpha reductase family enzyme
MNTYLKVVLIVFIYYLALFITGQIKKNNSIIDIFWGLGFVVAAFSGLMIHGAFEIKSLIVVLLVAIWGLRLTYHIHKRNMGKPEDFRYVNFRKQWGSKWVLLKAFLHVYMLQFTMLLLISSAFLNIIITNKSGLGLLDLVGIVVWVIGFYFESRSDYELKMFKADKANKGKILTSGLFKYSRHPNYFGEAVMWWGIYLMGLSSGGFIFIFSPITITILVRYVSGVPMLEKHYEGNEAFQRYAEKTSIFIPWFPR